MKIDADKDAQIAAKYADLEETWEDDSEAARFAAVSEYFDMSGDLRRATVCMEKASRLESDSARYHFRLARLHIKAQRYREGGRELEVSSEIDSVELAGRRHTENNLYYIGYALFHVGRYLEAAEALRGADGLVDTWSDPLVLKRFHLHQGFSWHLEGRYLDAAESYRRALVAPGPGDSCDEDWMDPDVVEAAQDFNDDIEPYLEMAKKGMTLDAETLDVVPDFP